MDRNAISDELLALICDSALQFFPTSSSPILCCTLRQRFSTEIQMQFEGSGRIRGP